MAVKSNDAFTRRLRIFSRGLPSTKKILLMLLLLSGITGLVSVAIVDYSNITVDAPLAIISGLLAGTLAVMLPTLLTALFIKYLKRYVKLRYVLFTALIGALVYAVSIIIASAAYILLKNYSLSTVIVLIGDASIFGWWFFVSKILLGQKKKAVLFAIVQPTLNLLLYLSSSRFIFTFSAPLWKLLVKLYAGIFVFVIVSYLVLYVLDRPAKKRLGFDGISVFSEMVQNWLFDFDTSLPNSLGGRGFGTRSDIETQALVFKGTRDGGIKGIMFAPWIHYGPVGTIAGSNFPYMLGRYGSERYKAPVIVLHCAVNEGNNPVSSSQFGAIRGALDLCVAGAKAVRREGGVTYSKSTSGTSTIHELAIGNVGIFAMTRAPRITEDVGPDAASVLRKLLEGRRSSTILLDAHNSRYETAQESELRGVFVGSKALEDYISAVQSFGKPVGSGRRLRAGFGSVEAYDQLGRPVDLAPGNINAAVFEFGSFRFCMVTFNANNMMPALRASLLEHIKKRHGIAAELFTTDTHFVNSLERTASNVLGRHTSHNNLTELVDKAVKEAIDGIGPVDVYYGRHIVRNFRVWGPDIRERGLLVISSVVRTARVLVPAIVVSGFIIGAWIISYV